jgi:geranylgeranyl diphosphate synthase type II
MIEEKKENSDLWQYVERHKPQIENALREHLPLAPANIETKFNEAVEYALFSGGKRLRPVLTLLGAELVGGKRIRLCRRRARSSLFIQVRSCSTICRVWITLPKGAGKTSLHEKFGEGLAVLVAIGFLNAAYGWFSSITAVCRNELWRRTPKLSNASARREWSAGSRLIWH